MAGGCLVLRGGTAGARIPRLGGWPGEEQSAEGRGCLGLGDRKRRETAFPVLNLTAALVSLEPPGPGRVLPPQAAGLPGLLQRCRG